MQSGADAVSSVILDGRNDVAGTSSASGSNGTGPVPFDLDISRQDDALLVAVVGEFDLGSTAEFDRVLAEVAGDSLGSVEIDLRKVTFIDSTGLRMLVETERKARQRGIDVRIVRGGHAVQRVFQLTGLDKVLPLVDG
jgi:anti-sigma B factor antagonist